MVWFDGLDLPLTTTLEAIFFENHPDDLQPVRGHNLSQRSFAGIGLKDTSLPPSPASHSPLLRYPWEETDRTLEALHREKGGPVTTVEYVNPLNGAPAVATFSCELSRLQPGHRTESHRKTGSSVYAVFRGSGHSVINGQAFEWGPGDIFVSPSWAAVDHEAAGDRADLFVIT